MLPFEGLLTPFTFPESSNGAVAASPQPALRLLRHFARSHTIDDADLKLLLVTDNIGDALEHIRTHAVEQFGLVERRMTPSRVLGERAA